MVQVNGIQFASSIGVLYSLKEARGHKTIQETYKVFEEADVETMVDILRVSYNRQNQTTLSEKQFFDFLEESKIGFVALSELFQKVVEAIMFDGLSEEEVAKKKNFMMSQKK